MKGTRTERGIKNGPDVIVCGLGFAFISKAKDVALTRIKRGRLHKIKMEFVTTAIYDMSDEKFEDLRAEILNQT